MSQNSSGPLEKDIQAKIMAYLKTVPGVFAWKAHTGGIYAASGIPDVLCVYNGRLFAFEVKRPGRRPTALQQVMIDKLCAAGAVALVVTGVEEVKEVIKLASARALCFEKHGDGKKGNL